MAEEKERLAPKSRLETLSDLIFGLALSIGALTLIGQSPSSIQSLLLSLAYYGFSFLILVRVWYTYTQIMADTYPETRKTVLTNIGLLFLVSVEPFLFNELLTSNLSTEYLSIIYAFDLAGLFIVQAILANSILRNKTRPDHVLYHYKLMRNTLIVSVILLFISCLPIFWIWVIPIYSGGIPLRFILWFIPILLAPTVRRLFEKQPNSELIK